MRGPPKTPTEILKLRGSFLPRSRPNEPQMESMKLECPSWANEKAREHWNSIAEVLACMQVSTVADRGAMVLMVDALAQYIEARDIVDRDGITATGSTGNIIVHPAAKVRDAAWLRVLKAMREFGMTPSSRASVATSKKKDDKPDGKSRFFNSTG